MMMTQVLRLYKKELSLNSATAKSIFGVCVGNRGKEYPMTFLKSQVDFFLIGEAV